MGNEWDMTDNESFGVRILLSYFLLFLTFFFLTASILRS